MKVRDIPHFSIRDWVPDAGAFAVISLPEAPPAISDISTSVHRNDFYTIYWITGGEGRFTIDAVVYSVPENTLVFMAPGQVVEVDEITPLQGWWIAFDEQFYCVKDEAAVQSKGISHQLFFNPDFATLLTPEAADGPSLQHILAMMEEECRGKGAQYDTAFFSLLQLFLIRVSRIMEKEERRSVEGPDANGRPFLQFRHLISQHYREKKNVSDYARMLHITPVCLNALSKDMSGITAGEQIRSHIIIEAKRLLHNTSLSAKEIAYQLGFEDAPYFSRFFKKYTGQTLLEFRDLTRKSTLLK